MSAVANTYGDGTLSDAVASNDVPQVLSPVEVPEPEEVAVEAAVTKRSSKTKAALASMLGALGRGATSLFGL